MKLNKKTQNILHLGEKKNCTRWRDENLITLHVRKIWVFEFIINKTRANHKAAFTDVSKLRVERVCIILVCTSVCIH
jgi:hypothetical protein